MPFYNASNYVYKDFEKKQEKNDNRETDGHWKMEHIIRSELDLQLDVKTPVKRDGTCTEDGNLMENIRAKCEIFQAIFEQINAKLEQARL